jgi:hypothetical protein
MTGNVKCASSNHIFHICALRECGLTEKNCKAFGDLIAKPEFKCEGCGETAEKAENLCRPRKT